MRPLIPTLLVAFLAAGCQAPRPASADAAKRAECRARTDQVYRTRNRAAMLLGTDQQSTPFASNYDVGNTSRGLGQLYGVDRAEAECLRGLGDATSAPASTGPAFTPAGP